MDRRLDPVAFAVVLVGEIGERPFVGAVARGRRARWVGEAVTDDDGRFSIPGVGVGEYEFVAVHPVLGRLITHQRVDGRAIVLQLQPLPRIRGRVLVDYLPVAGVPVRVLPLLGDLEQASDPTRLVAPSSVTGTDGRFELSVPPEGAGVLAIGGKGVRTVRFPYAPAEQLPTVSDLGDIVLSGVKEVRIRLNHGPCKLSAVGPVGQLGMEIVDALYEGNGLHLLGVPEPGMWWLHAECGGEVRAVNPPSVGVAEQTQQPIIDRATLDVER